MNIKEHLAVIGNEEANEVADAAIQLALSSLGVGKAFSKLLRFGETDINPERGLTAIGVLVAELNDQEAVVEMLQEAGVSLPGMHDRVAIEAKKAKVLRYMRYANGRGTLELHDFYKEVVVSPLLEPDSLGGKS